MRYIPGRCCRCAVLDLLIFVPLDSSVVAFVQRDRIFMLAGEHLVHVFFVLLKDGLPVDFHRAGDQTLS